MKKLESDQKAKAEHNRLLPICVEHVARGIVHVLTLNLNTSTPSGVPSKIEILRHMFERKEANSSLRLLHANRLLEELRPPLSEDDSDSLEIEEVHNVAALEVPALEGGGDGGGVDSMAAL